MQPLVNGEAAPAPLNAMQIKAVGDAQGLRGPPAGTGLADNMWTRLVEKLLCRLGRHDWADHERGFHQVCRRCGKTRWIIGR